MAYANLTPNLQDMFNQINDRLRKLESGPNSAQYSADSAQSTANSAQSAATTALANAATAYTAAQNSLQPSAYAIQDPTTKQLTAINSVGVTVYTNSPTTGARVVMNSNGLAGYNASGGTTFAISASDGSAHFAGSITGSSITGSTLNISGNCIIDSSGYLTATGATLTGQINATSGHIGGFSIVSNDYLNYGTTYIYGNSTSSGYAILDISKTIGAAKLQTLSSSSDSLYSSGGLQVAGTADITGNLQVHAMSSTSATGVVWSASNSRFYLTTSTERHKTNINPLPAADYLSKLLQLEPVTFTYKPEFTDNPDLLISGLIAEKVAEIPEFSTVVNLDADGLPESLAYDRLAMFMLPALKQINDRLTALEAK